MKRQRRARRCLWHDTMADTRIRRRAARGGSRRGRGDGTCRNVALRLQPGPRTAGSATTRLAGGVAALRDHSAAHGRRRPRRHRAAAARRASGIRRRAPGRAPHRYGHRRRTGGRRPRRAAAAAGRLHLPRTCGCGPPAPSSRSMPATTAAWRSPGERGVLATLILDLWRGGANPWLLNIERLDRELRERAGADPWALDRSAILAALQAGEMSVAVIRPRPKHTVSLSLPAGRWAWWDPWATPLPQRRPDRLHDPVAGRLSPADFTTAAPHAPCTSATTARR